MTCPPLEPLEPRRLLAGIGGIVWGDSDASNTLDEIEQPLANVTVFIDANRNGRLDSGETSDLTDVEGAYILAGLGAGTYDVTTVFPTGLGQTAPGRGGAIEHEYDIGLNYLSAMTASQYRAVEASAARWEAIITGDLPAVQTDVGLVDDIVIDILVTDLDGAGGTLAQAEPTSGRAGSFLPSRGLVEIDFADIASLEAEGKLVETITHEMAHVLGFGTIWQQLDLVAGEATTNPVFTGASATAEYNALFNESAAGVPLENGSGGGATDLVHWRENVLGTEQMTGFSEAGFEPISRITIGQFEDIGYEVNYDAADAYGPVPGSDRAWAPADAGVRPFTRRVVLTGQDQDDVDFGLRANAAPSVTSFTITPAPVQRGELVTLSARAADPDGEPVFGVTFYRESNGLPGLQSGGDTYVSTKFSTKRGAFAAQAGTDDLPAGEATYYAVAVDEMLFAGRRSASAEVIDLPTRPNPVLVTRQSSTSLLLQWKDRSADELGFRIEVSRDAGFATIERRYNVPANTRSSLLVDLVADATYFVRVRSYNIVGASAYTRASV